MSMNRQLRDLYGNWKDQLSRDNSIVIELSPPGLVCVSKTYEDSDRRILVIGQEDMGNQWDQDVLDETDYNYVGKTWDFEPIKTWADFLSNEDSVEALMAGYQLFDFAKHQPSNFRSPFWNAFRHFIGDKGVGCTTNLDRTSINSGAIDDGPGEARQYLKDNGLDALLREEIKILDPHCCIFLTGPNRDHLIDATWEGLTRQALSSEIPDDQLCRLSADGLPFNSYRTYHPGHLSRCNKGFYLGIIDRHIEAQP